ncbi:MAG: RNA polymerase sigma factor [Patescibacteria group bacterium]
MVENNQHNDCLELTDEQLVEQTLEDREKFACLMRRYEARLLRYVLRISGMSRDDAEDVLQDAFIAIYRNLHGFDRDRKFSTWAYRIVRNATISAARKTQVKHKYVIADVGDEMLERLKSDEDIALTTDRTMDAAIVHETLNSLKEDQREILVLHYLEGLGYAEISDVLMIAPGTVASRLSRAKQCFKKNYQDQQPNNL